LRDHAVPVAGVREILDVLGDLGPALERRASLSDRVEAMRQDEQAFAATVRAAAAELGMEADGLPPLHLDRVISARVQAARQPRARWNSTRRDAIRTRWLTRRRAIARPARA
jgi:hypothetical protein